MNISKILFSLRQIEEKEMNENCLYEEIGNTYNLLLHKNSFLPDQFFSTSFWNKRSAKIIDSYTVPEILLVILSQKNSEVDCACTLDTYVLVHMKQRMLLTHNA